jgi:hypothetical protein
MVNHSIVISQGHNYSLVDRPAGTAGTAGAMFMVMSLTLSRVTLGSVTTDFGLDDDTLSTASPSYQL